jgi:hypothetical protein
MLVLVLPAAAFLLQTYVLKLSKSGSDGEKVFLLLESGTRFHTVQASRCHLCRVPGCTLSSGCRLSSMEPSEMVT